MFSFPIIPQTDYRDQDNYNFFHSYFKSIYPEMYSEMLKNVDSPISPSSTQPIPTESVPQTVVNPANLPEKSESEIAAANKLRTERMLAGKYTIQGQVVKPNIPEFTGNEVGLSSSISDLLTGKPSRDMFEDLGALGKVNIMSLTSQYNENLHKKNIKTMVDSNGERGGAAMLYDPIKKRFHSVSLSETDLGETTAKVFKGITGRDAKTKTQFVGYVPSVVMLDGTVYDTTNTTDRTNLINAIKGNAPNLVKKYNIRNVNRDILGENISDSDVKNRIKTVIQSDTPKVPAPDPTYTLESFDDEQPKVPTPDPAYTLESFDDEQPNIKTSVGSVISTKAAKETADDNIFRGDYSFLNKGGTVNSGFIGGKTPFEVTDQESIADDIPLPAEEGGFVINAPAIENNPDEFVDLMSEAGVDINTSAGEYYLKPEDVDKIGMAKLQAFNQKGRPEVTKRIEASSGGFINGYAEGDPVELPATRPSSSLVALHEAIKNEFSNPEEARKVVRQYFKELTNEEALALTAITEAGVLGEKGLESVMHVANNRSNSTFADFKSQFTIKEVLDRQTAGGAFQFTGLEIKGEKDKADLRTHVRELVTNPQAYRKFLKTVDMAKDVISGKRRDFTGGALFYYNPKESTSKDFIDKVENRIYIPTYYLKNKYGTEHQYFVPQEIYSPPLPKNRPVEEDTIKEETQNFLNRPKTSNLSMEGILGTYKANRPDPVLY